MHWPIWRVAVAERSMEPALRPGDWLLVWRKIRSSSRPIRVRPGQIVVARHPGQPKLLLVKRVARVEADGWWLASDNPGGRRCGQRSVWSGAAGAIEGRVLCRYWRER